jgi:DNA-binding response OmpR family regulator
VKKEWQPRVLVVEDETNIRELVCLHLRHEGYECEGLADGATALKRSEKERYDLMVLDVSDSASTGCRCAGRFGTDG